MGQQWRTVERQVDVESCLPSSWVGVVSGNCTPVDILVSSRKGLPHDQFVVKELLSNRLQVRRQVFSN